MTETGRGAQVDGEDRVVGGRYRLLGKLGAGAMGAVWRAEDTVLGRDVAIKEVVFPPGIRPEEAEVLRERVRREARSAARLDHPSAVTVYDVVEEDGRPWLVMELVDARTLAEVVTSEGPLPPARVAQIGLAVLGALEAAHAQGIVHRDVKPGNVLLTSTGRIVLTDFGIATSAEDPSLTGTGLLLGSPAYIAPERARGNAPGPPSDLWSLGATLFTAVEGRPPYDGADALETVTAVVTGEHAPFVAAGALGPVLDGLLIKDPAQRMSGLAAQRLLSQVAGTPALHPPTGPVARPSTPRTDESTAALSLGDVAADIDAATDERQQTSVLPDPPVAPVAPAPVVDAPTASRPLPPPPRSTASPLDRTAPPRPPRVVRQAPAKKHRGPAVPLVVAAVLMVLAALGLAYSFMSDRDSGPRNAGPTSSTSSSPTPTTAGVPASWVTYTDPAGWKVQVPPEFARTSTSRGEIQFKDPDTRATLRVKATTPFTGTPASLSTSREAALKNLRSYDQLERKTVMVGDREAVDLELTFFDTVDLHVIDRSIVVDGTAYTLYWQTPQDEWAGNRALFETISSAFVPTAG